MDKPRLEFVELQKQRTACGAQDMAVVGGIISEDDLPGWLSQWDFTQMPWRLWEWVSDLRLEKETLPDSFGLMERGRLFGPGGDLTLRRDGKSFRWSFVGAPATTYVPTKDAHYFWRENPDAILHRIEQQAILWGEWKEALGRWYDNRVGWADLAYPEELAQKRHIYAHFWEYLDRGRVAFVWMYDLGDAKADPLLDGRESDGSSTN